MNASKKVLLIGSLLIAAAACAQAQQAAIVSGSAVSGGTITLKNPSSYESQTFEYLITGAPATASVVLKGCSAGGTCVTLGTSTDTTNTFQHWNTAFDYYTVVPTFTGGTAPALRVNARFGGGPGDMVRGIPVHGIRTGFQCIVVVSTATTVQAVGGSCVAPGAGLSLYITDIEFGTSAAAGVAADSFPTLKSGTGGTCGSATAVVWQALTTANSTVTSNYSTPFKVAANSELCWIMTTAGSKTIQIRGFIAQ